MLKQYTHYYISIGSDVWNEQLCDTLSVELLYIRKQMRDITIFITLCLADLTIIIILRLLNFIDSLYLSSLLHQVLISMTSFILSAHACDILDFSSCRGIISRAICSMFWYSQCLSKRN